MARQWFILGVSVALAGLWAACSRETGSSPGPIMGRAANRPASGAGIRQDNLPAACEQTAEYWRRQLGAEGHAIARPPFVLAGNLEAAELQEWHEHVVNPAAHVMAERFFDRGPDRPVVILLFTDETTYRGEADRLFGDRAISRHGYYRPHLNTIVVNAAAGRSALLHELTHALMAPDYPEAPAWLREGLASLHEDCRIDLKGPNLVPTPGARTATLQRALREDRLPSLETMILAPRFSGPQALLQYALARHFCLFLDHHGLLESVYRTARVRKGAAPANAAIVRHKLKGRSWEELDREFRRWAMQLNERP